jgi:hypothetical protein
MPPVRNTAQPTRRSPRDLKRPNYADLNDLRKSSCSPKANPPEAAELEEDYDSDATLIAEESEPEPELGPEWENYKMAYLLMIIHHDCTPDYAPSPPPSPPPTPSLAPLMDGECVGEGCEECARRNRLEMECTICNGTETGCTDRCMEDGAAACEGYLVEERCLDCTHPEAESLDS